MCIDAQMLSAYSDGELQEPYKTQVEEHLEHCSACRKLLDNIASLDKTLRLDSYEKEELDKNKGVVFDRLDSKFFKDGKKVSFFRRKLQLSVPTLITSAAAVTFIFVGGFMLFGSSSSQTEDILPSFSVNADGENIRYVSFDEKTLDDYTLEEILKYLDSKGYKVDISLKGLTTLEELSTETLEDSLPEE